MKTQEVYHRATLSGRILCGEKSGYLSRSGAIPTITCPRCLELMAPATDAEIEEQLSFGAALFRTRRILKEKGITTEEMETVTGFGLRSGRNCLPEDTLLRKVADNCLTVDAAVRIAKHINS